MKRLTVRDIKLLSDDIVKIFICNLSGELIGEYDDVPPYYHDMKVVCISTYNYGIELDVND